MSAKQPKSLAQGEPPRAPVPPDVLAPFALTALRDPTLQTTLDNGVRLAAADLHADLSAFFEYLPTHGFVAMRSGVGWRVKTEDLTAVPLQDICTPGTRPGSNTPIILPDMRSGGTSAGFSLLREHNVASGLTVGVERDGLEFGLLGVYTLARREFPPSDISRLQALAAVLSAAATRALQDQRLRESEARFSEIIAGAMDAIIAVDDAQRIVLFNQAAGKVFRVAPEQAIGTPLDRFIPSRYREAHAEHVRAFGERGATRRRMGRLGPLSGVRSDGEEFPIEASISHAEVAGQRLFTVILRDISERRRVEEQLLHAEKLKSVGRLAGGIAHDFNNVLTAVFGYLDLARPQAAGNGAVQECLDAIHLAARRAADLTSKLLAFARKQPIEPTIADLNQLVRNVLGMAKRLLGDDVEVVLHETPLLPYVRLDPGQFEQVLINLAVNARDAMPHGGKFIVETSRVELDEDYTGLHADVQPGAYVLLAISDTGAGMDPVTLEHCFEPFFTTKRPGSGTGLGLASCYGVVTQSGGHITVYSESNRGTTFRIFLPVCGDPFAEKQPEGAATDARSTGIILLVEDEPLVRGIAARALRDSGYTVIEAADAGEALSRAGLVNEPIDLLLTDVILPNINGSELAQRLLEQRSDLRVLYTSGFTDEMIAEQGLLPSGASFLPKPYTAAALLEKVRQVLKNSPSISDQT